MNISVLGCGRWGTFLAWYANNINHNALLWGREESKNMKALKENRKNSYLEIDENIILSSDLNETLKFGEVIIISINSQELRNLAMNIKNSGIDIEKKHFVLCMKGMDVKSKKRLSEIMYEELGENIKLSIWVGPGHVQDFYRGIPNCMVIDSKNREETEFLINIFDSKLIRFYYGNDLIGNEIGAALKNVVGIAAGMLDGLNYTSLKGALMARAPREVSRLIEAMGGKPMSAYGLSHLGDYEATLFSPYSNNRRFGEMIIKGEKFDKLSEGVSTVNAIKQLCDEKNIDMPICNAVYEVIFNKKNPNEILTNLFIRSLKEEFY